MTASICARVLLTCALALACGSPRAPLHSRSNRELPAQRRATLVSDGSVAVGASYSRSGRHVAVAGATNAVRVWDVATGAQVGTLPENGGDLVSAGADDDTFIIYHSSRWTFTVWNWRTAAIRHFSAYDALAAFGPTADAASELAIISHVAVSPDGTRLLTRDEHATGLVLWNVATGTPQRFIPTRVNAVAFLSGRRSRGGRRHAPEHLQSGDRLTNTASRFDPSLRRSRAKQRRNACRPRVRLRDDDGGRVDIAGRDRVARRHTDPDDRHRTDTVVVQPCSYDAERQREHAAHRDGRTARNGGGPGDLTHRLRNRNKVAYIQRDLVQLAWRSGSPGQLARTRPRRFVACHRLSRHRAVLTACATLESNTTCCRPLARSRCASSECSR